MDITYTTPIHNSVVNPVPGTIDQDHRLAISYLIWSRTAISFPIDSKRAITRSGMSAWQGVVTAGDEKPNLHLVSARDLCLLTQDHLGIQPIDDLLAYGFRFLRRAEVIGTERALSSTPEPYRSRVAEIWLDLQDYLDV